MLRVEAILRPESVEQTVEKLEEIGCNGITKKEVEGHGKQKGIVEQFRGKEYKLTFIPKVKIEMVIKDELKEKVVNTIIEISDTGRPGDGKIFISEEKNAIRVRTNERGEVAL